MIQPKPSANAINDLLDRHWVGIGYAAFSLALLVLAALPLANVVVRFPTALLLLILLLAVPFTGILLSNGQQARGGLPALVLLIVDGLAALGLIAVTGGAESPLWIALLLVSTATPLLLRGRWAAGLLIAIWLADAFFLINVPREGLVTAILTWALRASGVGLIGLGLYRAIALEEGVRRRAQRREQVLYAFLDLSNQLRVTSKPQTILEEVAQTVQASGKFDCVTLSQIDWHTGLAKVMVAIGASGRRMTGIEGLEFAWDTIAPLLHERRRVGPNTFRAEGLPFRTLKNELHFILPLNSQFSETLGMLTVSGTKARQEALEEALPLLELLANQAAAAFDNNALYATMEQRVVESTETIERNRTELAQARDRAETLYQIVRALAVSLDEREVLTRALQLVAHATSAQRGGIMLIEPNTGRLVYRTTIDLEKNAVSTGAGGAATTGLDRGQGLAGWVLASRQTAIIADTMQDTRWQARKEPGTVPVRSALAVPLLLEDEPMGVLMLLHENINHFRAEQGQMAVAVANQIAVSLSKAQLYRYVSEQSERLGLMLQQREEEISKNEAILSSIADGVVVCDRLGRIRLINPAAAEILEINAAVFMGRQMSELPGVPLELQSEQPEGSQQQLEVGVRSLHAHFAPVLSTSGEWLGGVVVYHDISREALSDRLKTEFIATASHELRTPLTSIRGYVDLLLLGTLGPLSQAQSDFLKVVKNNVARLVELIDDLLDVSKVESGELRLRREPVDVAEVLYEVGESLYSQFTERDISLAIEVQEGLPKLMADRRRLRQIAVNLVGNACKYTPTGGHVDVRLRNGGNRLRVDIHDTGVGIMEAAREHIFTPFYRADNPLREEVGGTGLGLSITKKLVELHGGEIWFDSNEGQGSTFSFTLPLDGGDWTQAEWLEQAK